jgi:Tol biopolymer transport system component
MGRWSRDGRWIYFSSDRTGTLQLWKLPNTGGPAVQVTRGGGFDAAESWDGQYLYYTKGPRSGVWRQPLGGGGETEVVKGPLATWGWALARSGVYYAVQEQLGGRLRNYTIRHLELNSGQTTEVYQTTGPNGHTCLAVSPDERWILHTVQPAVQSELMLVENFR